MKHVRTGERPTEWDGGGFCCKSVKDCADRYPAIEHFEVHTKSATRCDTVYCKKKKYNNNNNNNNQQPRNENLHGRGE